MSQKYDPEVGVMRQRLDTFFAQDPERQLCSYLIRLIRDPLRPVTAKERLPINPLLLLVGGMVLLAMVAFVFFSYS
jgi:hypothetical protein